MNRHPPRPIAWRLRLIAGLALAAAFICIRVQESNAALGAGVDVALILDDSGSTVGALNTRPTDLTGRRCVAGQMLVDLLDPTDGLALIRFADKAATTQAYALVNPEVRESVAASLGSCDGRGDTNYVDALGKTFSQLGQGSPDRPKFVIFATDGEPTVGGGRTEILDLARKFGERGWRIFPVAFDVAVDQALLEDIADASGGRFFFARNANQITDVFQQIFAGQREFVRFSDQEVCPGSNVRRLVPGTAEQAQFVVVRPAAGSVTLGTPPGATIQRRAVRAVAGSPQVYEVVSAATPSGMWTFQVSGPGCASLGTAVRNATRVSLASPSEVEFTGQPIPLNIAFRVKLAGSNDFVFDRAVQVSTALSRRLPDGTNATQPMDLRPEGDTFIGTYAALNDPGIASLDFVATREGERIYESPAPFRFELINPPRVSLVEPTEDVRADRVTPVRIALAIEPAAGISPSEAVVDVVDGKGQLVQAVHLSQADDRTWSGLLTFPESSEYRLRSRVRFQARGQQLGRQGTPLLTLPERLVRVQMSTPALEWSSPMNVSSLPGTPVQLAACLKGLLAPLPSGARVLASVADPSGDLELPPSSPGCYSGAYLPPRSQYYGSHPISVRVAAPAGEVRFPSADRSIEIRAPDLTLVRDYPDGRVAQKARLRLLTVSGSTAVQLEALRASGRIQGPQGREAALVLTQTGDAVEGDAEPWASGEYAVSVQLAGMLANQPVTLTGRDERHWVVAPALQVRVPGERWDVGSVWSWTTGLDSRDVLVSSNSDLPIDLRAATSDNDVLSLDVAPSQIPAFADGVRVHLTPHFRGEPPEGDHTLDVQLRALQQGAPVEVRPADSFPGYLAYRRPSWLQRAVRAVSVPAGIVALIVVSAALGLGWRRRRLPDAAKGMLTPVSPGPGARAVSLEASHRGWRRAWLEPQSLRLCGRGAETKLLAPGTAEIRAHSLAGKTTWALHNHSAPDVGDYVITRRGESPIKIAGEKASALYHNDRIKFGATGPEYIYSNPGAMRSGAASSPVPASRRAGRPEGWA